MFKVITDVEEAAALCRAGLAWWRQVEPAHKDWPDYRSEGFAALVEDGIFSILLED